MIMRSSRTLVSLVLASLPSAMAGAGGACRSMKRWLSTAVRAGMRTALIIMAVACAAANAVAVNLSLSPRDMERELAIARWPSLDRDRARFHEPYVFRVDGPTVDYITVQQ